METPLPQIIFDDPDDGIARAGAPVLASTVDGSDCRAAIEAFPHLALKVQQLWATRDLDTFVHNLLIDSRDGKRQGFPVEVAAEFMFIAKLNLLVRAMAAAPLLQVSLAEACEMVASGDRAALGLVVPTEDPWREHSVRPEKAASTGGAPRLNIRDPNRQIAARAPAQKVPVARAAEPPPASPAARAPSAAAETRRAPAAAVQATVESSNAPAGSTQNWLSILLSETPPFPSTIRLDLTAPDFGFDSGPFGGDGKELRWDLFRCLTREIRGLGAEELVLTNLGDAAKCVWLPEAVQYAKRNCQFPQVVLRTDLLAATEPQIDGAIAAGLSSLIFNFDLASNTWRACAEESLAANPDYFVTRLQRIVQKRDEHYSRTRQRCVISVSQIGTNKSSAPLKVAAKRLAEMADLKSFDWRVESLGQSAQGHHAAGGGDCLCWVPFTEAHVRANGHLVVCQHDYSGVSDVADLKETEFETAWLSDAFRKTRQGLLKHALKGTLCAHCPLVAAKDALTR